MSCSRPVVCSCSPQADAGSKPWTAKPALGGGEEIRPD
ncbi:hypothetical protein ASZ90_019560 [hydrocarbon metagenome]|uniref:Uncharacterized protein n=1 Tax=hydrocarbon metagenome TaxID=938273 RepID=A0A0W8E3H1_9ZZZZ